MQELKSQLNSLSMAMEASSDDDTKREYFTKLLLSFVNQALEEISSIEQEKSILEYMSKNAGGMNDSYWKINSLVFSSIGANEKAYK